MTIADSSQVPITLSGEPWIVHCPHPAPPAESVYLALSQQGPQFVLCDACTSELRELLNHDTEPRVPRGRLYLCPPFDQAVIASMGVFASNRESAGRKLLQWWEQVRESEPATMPLTDLMRPVDLGTVLLIWKRPDENEFRAVPDARP